jgi:hypothetical protein
MASDNNYTVRFSRKARILEYDDSEGHVEFAFDGSSKGPKHISLEHGANIPRGARYDIVFERVRQFLQSCGYEVEIYDPATSPPVDVNALIAAHERAGFHVEKTHNGFIVTKEPRRGIWSRIFSFFR